MQFSISASWPVVVTSWPGNRSGYWNNQLSGAPERIAFSTSRHCSVTTISKECLFKFALAQQYTDKLQRIGHQYGASLPTVLLTAFHVLLFRYTHQTDLVVGCPAVMPDNGSNAGEDVRELLPVRANLAETPFFADLLRQVQNVVDAVNIHHELVDIFTGTPPLDEEDALSFSPNVIFAFSNVAAATSAANSTIVNKFIGSALANKVELAMVLEDTAAGITGTIQYDAAFFDAEAISGMAGHYQVLINEIIADPAQQVAKICLLQEAERNKLLYDWNDTKAEFPLDKCIHQLFEAQVKTSPQAVAAVLHPAIGNPHSNAGRHLTYAELDKRANQVAHYLQSIGVGPDVMVGVFMKRSLEMAVAILGILKAGGAYLPLDSGYPKERLDFIFKDSGVSILLTQYQLLSKLPAYRMQVTCLDAEWSKIALYNDTAPGCAAGPQHLAYVIYTSGSTGLPKGTLIEHRGVVNYLSWCLQAYKVNEGDGCPVNSSIGFDATVTSFLAPLVAGKKIMLLPEDGEVEALAAALQSNNTFSLIKITPAHLEILNNLLAGKTIDKQANVLVIGGELLTGKSLDPWRKHAPGTRLINEYGPTETVVGCCIYEVPAHKTFVADVPIGRPIANTQIYILDKFMQPVPTGVAGEIYIGGAGVARGYLNRPELTAERFIPDPFSNGQYARLYKTGDIARYLPDGNIVFLGRADSQVKIRGYRIELGEIEHTLQQCDCITQAVVIAKEDKAGDKQLVSYFVPDSAALASMEAGCMEQPSAQKLQQANDAKTSSLLFAGNHSLLQKNIRKMLLCKLPEYMVPAELIAIRQLPLTANGKIDYAALPAPNQQRTDTQKTVVAAHSKLEKQLANLFEKALGITNISILDNVFDLGLNSLQAYRLFVQVKKITGIQLPLSVLIKAPTIEQLAAHLTCKEAHLPWSSLVPIQPKGTKPPLYLVHAGAGTVLFYRELANYLGEDQPVYGLQPQGLDGRQRFHNSVEEMAQHYVQEIRTANPHGPYLIGGYCFGAVVAFDMAQILRSQGANVALLANFNGVSPVYNERLDKDIQQLDNAKSNKHLKPVSEERIGFTWKSLAQKSNQEKLRYLSVKIRNRVVNRWGYKIGFGYIMLLIFLYKLLLAVGLRSPAAWRKHYFHLSNSKMVYAYKPKPYPGVMNIFRSPGIYHDPHLGWGSFVTGRIDTCNIPGYHINRRFILKEPFVEITAQELTNYIDKAIAKVE